jgi:hypothetical protein
MRRQAQARNPCAAGMLGEMDSGFALRAPRNDDGYFVDLIFTTFMQAAFTKASAVNAELHAIACLCRARNAD